MISPFSARHFASPSGRQPDRFEPLKITSGTKFFAAPCVGPVVYARAAAIVAAAAAARRMRIMSPVIKVAWLKRIDYFARGYHQISPVPNHRFSIPALCLLGALFAAATALRSADQDVWWPDYAGGPASARYVDARQITKANVAKLAIAWSYPFGETGSNPIVVGGMIYGRGRNGSLIAVDAKTGKEVWIREGMQAMTARGMNYWASKDGKDRRLIFAMNDYLQAIDAATGQPVYSFGKDGVVDLREGLGRDPATIGRIQSGTPGRIFENLILLGSATGEGYLSPPGDLRAFDVSPENSSGSSTPCRIRESSATRRGQRTPTSTSAV